MTNPLRQLADAGQSVWLDFLNRDILRDGSLQRMIDEDGLGGLTSNPSIFEKAIGGRGAYDDALRKAVEASDAEVIDLYEGLAIADIQAAADLFAPYWKSRNGRDGFVSLEVSPYLAHDTAGSIAEARRLWRAVDRPNLMVKVPGTPEGVPAIRQLIGEGININVTLLFGVEAYAAAAEAYISGLEAFAAGGGDVSRVHSVASLFVSRIDGMIDAAIDARAPAASPEDAAALRALRGKVAIANAKAAYGHYEDLIATPRWRALADAGAAPQRLLWASTGTKDPAYSDVLYVEGLVGRDTVNTMPPATLEAFRDHGVVHDALWGAAAGARATLAEADRLGLDLPRVMDDLVMDGVTKFSQSFDELLGAVASKRTAILGDRLNGQRIAPGALADSFGAKLKQAATEGWARRLWTGDASLWTGADEAKWLGWLGAGGGASVDLAALDSLRAAVKAVGFTHALLLGMGGSSLGPEVLSEVFGPAQGHPALLVLDSTQPDQVARVAGLIDPAHTLFIVASKSGSTLEPDVLHRYFFQLAEEALGKGQAGSRFIAITDPGSKLETLAAEQGFWRVFPGEPSIGGRYSVLSNFGMVPAAILGLDPHEIFESVSRMTRSCGASAPPAANPGVSLGVLLGAGGLAGRDKVTFIASPAIAPLGAWLEQLIAESTGKIGKGLIPVNGETPGEPADYGVDRVFCRLAVTGDSDEAGEAAAAALEAAGHPVVRITLASANGLFQEFFRWETATAIAGAVIGLDPFDQPDVEASKVKTRALTDAYESGQRVDQPSPMFEADGVAIYADAANAAALAKAVTTPGLEAYLAAQIARAAAGDYLGILAYIDRNPAHTEVLQVARQHLRDVTRLATVLQFGPRFLHSTGQAYKGGPNTGVFLQITADPAQDLAIPGRAASFGVVVAAEAQGDLAVLEERGRRAIRLHIHGDVSQGLARIAGALGQI
jgi:transaldolase/glucose-6-phosphate isomerase